MDDLVYLIQFHITTSSAIEPGGRMASSRETHPAKASNPPVQRGQVVKQEINLALSKIMCSVFRDSCLLIARLCMLRPFHQGSQSLLLVPCANSVSRVSRVSRVDRVNCTVCAKRFAFAMVSPTPPSSLADQVPDNVSDAAAVFAEPLAAACRIVEQGLSSPEDDVAILGDGKLGLLIGEVLARRAFMSPADADLEELGKTVLLGRHKDKMSLCCGGPNGGGEGNDGHVQVHANGAKVRWSRTAR